MYLGYLNPNYYLYIFYIEFYFGEKCTYWYTSEHFTISYVKHIVCRSIDFNMLWTTSKSARKDEQERWAA